jgi:hypothetical protein
MRADGIVVVTPSVENDLRFGHRREDVAVQAFVAQFVIEAFDERMLDGFARSNEIETHVVREARHPSRG